jgi:energy-coupling factor transporter transmembrane protein EcfT
MCSAVMWPAGTRHLLLVSRVRQVYGTAMLQTLLTVLLLVAGFVAGLRYRSVRRVAAPLAVLWAAVMVTNFMTAQVAQAGDWVAFVLSAVMVFGLVLGPALVGARVAARRT